MLYDVYAQWSAAADRLRDRDNAEGIDDNSAEIGDGTAGTHRERDPMLNSVLNRDWTLE